MEANKRIAVGYCRVSTREQSEQGYSIAAQQEAIKQYCDKNGLELTNMYIDAGISGKSISKRPQMRRLLKDCDEGNFDVLVVWKNSRVARNLKNLLEIIDVLDKSNVELQSISEPLALGTPSGKMMLQVMGSFSEFERNTIAENVVLGMNDRARTGYPNVGQVLGYEPVIDEDGKRNLAVVEDEASIIRFMFNAYAQGLGYRAIANRANKMGYVTKRGNPFSTVAVKTILSNPLYVGKVRYGKYQQWEQKRRKGLNDNVIESDGKHPAIIDAVLWQTVQTRMQQNSIVPKWNQKGQNVLTGLLRCPECGSAMAVTWTVNRLKDGTKKRLRYYTCSQFKYKGASVCHANSIRADIAERLVEQKLNLIIGNESLADSIVQQMKLQQEGLRTQLRANIAGKQEAIKQVSQKLARLKALEATDTVDLLPAITQRTDSLGIESATLQQEMEEMKEQLAQVDLLPRSADIDWLLRLVQRVCEESSGTVLKQLYHVFISSVTFDRLKKLVWVNMKFDKNTIQRLQLEKGEANRASSFLYANKVQFTI
ncbi:recombinase family protein [Lacticaseibacillus saniviri]